MIIKKSPAEIDKMARAGDILVRTMDLLAGKVRPGVTTAELDQAAERFIRSQGATPSVRGPSWAGRRRSTWTAATSCRTS